MPIGLSLHIGLDHVNAEHYPGLWELSGCEADARLMEMLAREQGFAASRLINESATRETVRTAIHSAAAQLKSGDVFLLTYAGHGGQLSETGTEGDEIDNYDETWCLFDGQLLDDELLLLWSEFAAGVRIVLLSDSCHSGTVSTCVFEKFQRGEADATYYTFRYMPRSLDTEVLARNRPFYEQVREEIAGKDVDIQATVVLFAACRDDEFAQEWEGHGLFTRALIDTWDSGSFEGNYEDLHQELLARVSEHTPLQHPVFSITGPNEVNFQFQKPFVI